MWSKFTQNNIKLFKNKIVQDNRILKKMNKEKEIISNRPNINYEIVDYIIDEDLIKKFANCKFVYYKGVMDSLNQFNINKKITFNNHIIYLKCTTQQFDNINKILVPYIKMIDYLSNKNITMYLILTNLKKQIYNKNEELSAKNINSGYTDLHENYIFIWRYEEFIKVTFHELIHYTDRDHRNDTKYYEAITDYKAIYYNIIFLSIVTNEDIKDLLNYEINFINNQYNYMKQFKFKKNSNAYSYYIIKCYLINKLFTNIYIPINNYNLNSCRMTLLELE